MAEAIDSSFAQTYRQIEVVVVDDGSSGDTAEYLGGKYGGRIRYCFQTNRGVAGARNKGLQLALGEYIQFLDADDLLQPVKIERQLDTFAASPAAAVVYSDFDYFLDGDYSSSIPSPASYAAKRRSSDTFEALLSGNFIVVHGALTRRAAIVDVGGFDESLRLCDDYDLWLRMSQRGAKFVYCEGVLARYRLRAGSMSSDRAKQIEATIAVLEKVRSYCHLDSKVELTYEHYLSELKAEVRWFYRWVMARRLWLRLPQKVRDAFEHHAHWRIQKALDKMIRW